MPKSWRVRVSKKVKVPKKNNKKTRKAKKSNTPSIPPLFSMTHQDIMKNFVVQSVLHGNNDFNVIYETDEGDLFSCGSSFEDIKDYLVKYIENGTMNDEISGLNKIESEMTKSVSDGKYSLIYICAKRGLDFGANIIFKADKDTIDDLVRKMKVSNFMSMMGL